MEEAERWPAAIRPGLQASQGVSREVTAAAPPLPEPVPAGGGGVGATQSRQQFRSKHHGLIDGFDFFISYRVAADRQAARELFLSLDDKPLPTLGGGTGRTRVFLDSMCLNDGEDWEVGFLRALQHSAVVLLLCSEAGLSNIRGASARQDNVLLEVEASLERHSAGQCELLRLLL